MDKLFSVELSAQNLFQIEGAIKCAIDELSKHQERKLNKERIIGLKTLLNYLESF